jgi:alpha-tubulin suppressor-like RCC1 family protein
MVELAAGGDQTCARDAAGVVRCWGRGVADAVIRPTIVTDLTATALAVGRAHACAIRGDGTAVCWGANDSGQRGDGSTSAAPAPTVPTVVVGLDRALQLAAGGAHTCAVRIDGAVLCWGADTSRQLGDGRRTDLPRPEPVTLSCP